ncbi:MAG TPA: aminotransferase class IV [Candidatus Acidoferrales bacterium]|nr:aminotransferase class IV [Candidatus Acidoferrales bacterium]
MLHRFIFHNDKLVAMEEARLSPGQAGLLNGWGLFTTLHVFDGELFAFERHWKRLEKDAARTHCPLPFEAEKVREQLREVIRANHVKEGAARIYAIYNRVGHWRSDEHFPLVDLILVTTNLPEYRSPARLNLRAEGRHATSPLAGVKVTSWLNNAWNAYEAQQAGFDEVVLLNERGEVSECTAANVFCVRGGKVQTPPLGSGCLEGITRSILLEIGPRIGISCAEATLRPEDLYAAEEVFISSTNRNLLPVGEIAGHRYANAPGPVTRRLDEAFSAYIKEYLAGKAATAKR